MWAHVCTCGHLMYRCVYMCRVYVARSGRDQRILVALPLPPLPIPFSGPLIFHLCCFWKQIKRMSNRDSHPQGCC